LIAPFGSSDVCGTSAETLFFSVNDSIDPIEPMLPAVKCSGFSQGVFVSRDSPAVFHYRVCGFVILPTCPSFNGKSLKRDQLTDGGIA
jgi:hypothetical protein